MKLTIFTILFSLAVAVQGAKMKGGPNPVTKDCLRCLCESQSNCDMTKKCTHSNKVCGPFRLTKPFWVDASSPTPPGIDSTHEEAFQECSFDFDCASTAVKNYMEAHAQDCNGDGKINCIDYAHIFRLGPYGCNNDLDNMFKTRFNSCKKQKKL